MCSTVRLRFPFSTSETMLGVPKMSTRSFCLRPLARMSSYHPVAVCVTESRVSRDIMVPAFERAGVAELADAPDSKSGAAKAAWGFNSPLQHQKLRALFLPVESAKLTDTPSPRSLSPSQRNGGESLPEIAPYSLAVRMMLSPALIK